MKIFEKIKKERRGPKKISRSLVILILEKEGVVNERNTGLPDKSLQAERSRCLVRAGGRCRCSHEVDPHSLHYRRQGIDYKEILGASGVHP